MRRMLTAILVVTLPAISWAQLDHLQCYKVKDPLKLSGVLDLTAPPFGLAAGCKVSSAKLYCVPATKAVVSATDRGTGLPITPLPLAAAPAVYSRVCYKVRCPTPVVPLADQNVTDQFGNRLIGKLKAAMVCTPGVPGADYCGDGTVDPGESCEAGNLGGATCATVGYPNGGTLACGVGCAFDTSGCRRGGLPVTGQTIAYTADKNDGTVGAVAVPDDGTLEAGTPYNYTNNGDGTVTDHITGLMWEKKSDDGSLHDRDNEYRWSGDGSQETIWDWLDDVNVEGGPGFAGYADWRIPNVRELESIQRLEGGTPGAVHPVFDVACVAGCTVLTCACTAAAPHWTSTTVAGNPPRAWYADFSLGGTIGSFKTDLRRVRAVRSTAP
jgi:Protein of unknown function (DUF1566)